MIITVKLKIRFMIVVLELLYHILLSNMGQDLQKEENKKNVRETILKGNNLVKDLTEKLKEE